MPLGHFSVQSFERGDGAVDRVDVEQPLQIRVSIDGVSVGAQTHKKTR